ncbi:MAG TPA: 3-dehydroquinate synthase [Solirubrobacteraceae bacterium]|nr:3-dehydroquinate synthase [Solirubrobacteraceae bacterium]
MARTALIGFMGAGKTTAAQTLGGRAVDVDETIEARFGRPIPAIFAEQGEAAFRALEEQVTLELLDDPGFDVVSLGGGGVRSERVRRALGSRRVVWLWTVWEDAWQRVREDEFERPLARDPARFQELHEARQPVYESLADVVVPATRSRQMPAILAALEGLPAKAKMLWASAGSADYPVYVGSGLITDHRFWPETVGGRRLVVTDYNAGRHYAEFLEPIFGRVAIMPGEQSKTVAHAEIVWTEMVRHGLTRSDVVIALGGGVVGDLAGFCAATYQRGVRYVQVPTTLVAQVDSAYGGKTGVDLPEAKNYVGAFHQPSAVLCDPLTLSTLPLEELSAGAAEVIKTGLIAGGGLWELLEAGAEVTDPGVITRCVLAKLRIVAQDERDQGLRQLLNLGHTVGHAIETCTGYARYRHGEAVGLGLLAELRLSGAGELRERVREMMVTQGLPVQLRDADVEAVVAATSLDKKRTGDGPVPFVLCSRPGQPILGQTVAPEDLRAAVQELTEG